MAGFHPNEATEAINNASPFYTNMVFESCQDLIDWTQEMGRSFGYIIIIKQRKIRASGLLTKVLLICDRGGTYKSKNISSRNTGTKKINCPFELKGKYSKLYNFWTLSVVCDKHNHEPAEHFEGHAFVMRLSDNETRLVADLTRLNVKPHDILTTLKEQNPENVSTLKTIYNARDKIKMNEKAGKTDIQLLLSFLEEGGYTYFYRANDISNVMEDLFFMHPTSVQLWHAFPYVMLMDATYKTNKYNMPLLEIVGVTPTNLTFCIAFVFMHQEKVFNYTWALNCLKSVVGSYVCPQVIVTDRELALMKACKNVFPNAGHLLCRWHIFESIKKHCRNSIRPLDTLSFFTKSWASLVESQTEETYYYNLARLETLLLEYKVVKDYLHNIWLKSYKHMFVSAWTDRFLSFGNHTNNRAESQHSILKNYLDATQSDLSTCTTFIHKVIRIQLASIKASLEQSKKIMKHRFKPEHFELLWRSVSLHALDIIYNELERCNISDLSCNCQLHVILHSISNIVNTTYFPLWSTPPPMHEQVAIAIGFVNNNHYVRVILREEYLMPPVYLQWNRYRRPQAAAWITPYIDRINLYAQFLNSNHPVPKKDRGEMNSSGHIINQNQSEIQSNSSVFVKTNPNIQLSEPYTPIQIIQLDNSVLSEQ
ncbi:hypothetical protein LXL04_031551 [Taraxacum kok-saghyz]